MFIYLSKKIAIPNNTRLKCIAWNKDQGYIACGGDDGLLKVLKLEAGKDGKIKGLAAPSNLSMNQTLEGHNGQIQVVGWNENHQKLTSSDQYGLIIVWMLYKGSWYEEMINNRNKSVVKGMAWNSDGHKICIVYEDGAVIVGSVDGNRIWGKELKGTTLSGVCWSPDSRLILFSLASGEVHVYDSLGGFVSKLLIQCLANLSQVTRVVSLKWYDGRCGHPIEDAPTLAICYDNGRVQIMRNETDDNPILIDTAMSAVCCEWNHDGSILAIAGTMSVASGVDKDANVVQFYNPFGDHLRTLKIPGKQITSCAWEGESLRIALAVDSFIYFANIRPDYRWTFFAGNTVVYTFSRQTDRTETAIVFWNTKTQERNVKYVKRLYAITSWGDHCAISTLTDDEDESTYIVLVCNALGTTVDNKQVLIEPTFLSMVDNVVFIASKDAFYVWRFSSAQVLVDTSAMGKRKKEQLYHIDDNSSGIGNDSSGSGTDKNAIRSTQDPICCITASDKMLIVGRESGQLHRYSLPNLTLISRFKVATKPYKVAVNCNSSRLSVIDVTGLLQFVDIDSSGTETVLKFERKDVWDMKWAVDNPDLFAMMEKTRMYIFKNLEPEEPILSAGYICSFRDLEIKAVLLDEVLRDPENPSEEFILDLEVKSLRDIRELLDKSGLGEAHTFVEDNPHPRLWRLLAEAALEKLDFTTAEAAFVRSKDYPAIQFVKRLQNIQNKTIQKAEVSTWFNHFDEAEKLYMDVDRRDLAISLRKKLGDWFRVAQLLKTSSSGNDAEMEEAWNNIGHYYAERQNWQEAVQHYEKSRNIDRLVDCYYFLEDYYSLESLVETVQPDDPLLLKLGEMFSSVGMGKQAIDAFVKGNHINSAIETCVSLNQWHDAVELATKYNQPTQVSSLLAQYASHLLDENKIIQAIELYRKANHFLEAAKLLNDLAIEETFKRSSPLRIKKIYVLSGLLVEEHLSNIRKTMKGSGVRSSTLIGMGKDSKSDIDIIGKVGITGEAGIVDNAWRGAEAYHFLMLCQRQLYEGFVDAAMKTALNLRDYEDVLNNEDIYSLLALASCANRAFGTCSKAFIKLESLEELSEDQREDYQELAMEIFIKHSPKDSRNNRAECASCETMIPDWSSTCPSCQTKFPICIVSGRPLMDLSSVWTCDTCHHRAYEQDVTMRQNCPLCHTPINA